MRLRRIGGLSRGLVVAAFIGLVLSAPTLSAQEAPLVIRQLDFEGNRAIDELTLRAVIGTTNSSWFARSGLVRWIGLGEKRYFDEREFQRDVLRLTLLYRKSGYLDVAVDTLVVRKPQDIYLTVRIEEHEPVLVTALDLAGLDTLPEPHRITQDLPLRIGDPFNRFLMQASADTIVRRLQDRGYPSAEVFQNFDMDKAARTARVGLDVYPGLRSTVGPVRVTGTRAVDSSVVLSLLATRQGNPFSQDDLFRSQRNLYQTELFSFAAVGIDSADFSAEVSSVPLLVQVNEGRFHRVRTGVGFGTDDCFRLGAGWTARNFIGGGQVFDISGRISKLGVGSPFDWNLEEKVLCGALREDSIASAKVNYNVTLSLRRPAFLSPQNTATVALFAERRSSYNVYRREEVGFSVGLSRETRARIPLNFTYRLSYGQTDANAANFCAFFNTCLLEDIRQLEERRILATFTTTATASRTNNPLDPSRGFVASGEFTHSSRFIGSSSQQQFNRFVGDVAWYRPVGRGLVLSWRLRGGLIFAPTVDFRSNSVNFVPPEQRFYAGGPNDVRGYNRNELGPVVYVIPSANVIRDTFGNVALDDSSQVRFSATGGNTLVVGNIELRVPSPIFRRRLRFAAFLDAGGLWQRGETEVAPAVIRFTPGVGIRVATPLGPARLDVAYNPYDLPSGQLFESTPNGELLRLPDPFVRDRGRRYTVHFSVGQPF
jgi:outer membrane protein assembly complex protein YaeT